MAAPSYFLSNAKKLQSRLRVGMSGLKHEIEDKIKMARAVPENDLIVNEKEIRITGLRRSGNHAIMNWIRKQHKGEVFYINNARIKVNPFRHVYEDQVRKLKDRSIQGWRTDDMERWRREAAGEFAVKNCLIYSYEDQPMEAFSDRTSEKRHDLYFGRSKVRYDLIIIRDPFNLFASRIRASRRTEQSEHFADFMKVKSRHISLSQLWIDYAREYLYETNYLHNIKVPINYNQWVLDVDYRRQIAEKLELDFTDSGFNEVMANGGGSSFDGVGLQGKASEMSVLERWRHFAEEPDFRALVGDRKILEYSLKIFGLIPGTDCLHK